jgi:aryl-alcohol dehydrogenase-like predicted oxidoreductase
VAGRSGPTMEVRVFGRTGMQLSVLGFGCGAVGGLMVRGDPLDQERVIAAGDGESEKNLGRILQKLKPVPAVNSIRLTIAHESVDTSF